MVHLPFVHTPNITIDTVNANSDQLAQMTVDAAGAKTNYFLFWDRRGGVWTQVGQQGPIHYSATDKSIMDLIAFFHGVPDAVVTDLWTERGQAPGNQVINLHFKTLKERHHVVSVDLQV